MIPVNEAYLDVLDRINDIENGQLTNDRFNRFSWLGQLSLIDWLSGDVSNIAPPQPYLSQKNKDWLSPFITKYAVQVSNGIITKPSDFYGWENGYLLGNYNVDVDGEEGAEETIAESNITIDLIDGDKFYNRCNTYIEGLKPSFKKPITKMVGSTFEFMPRDLGSITLEYIRLPIKSNRVVTIDPILNDEVYVAASSTNFEWPEYARGILVWFIADLFSNFTREQALKQFNAATQKTVRA